MVITTALNEALNYQNIETHPEKISKIKLYISRIFSGVKRLENI